ncbi:MAG: DUF5009 domain-containing protein, partial [Kiritimatiellae bacterium]|nr:DUF5009 domain-containing protein [Kiritimatiellia bacterium]
ITIYMLRPIVDINKTVTFFLGGIMSCCPEIWADFILSCGYVTICWLVLWFLYKKGVFLRV